MATEVTRESLFNETDKTLRAITDVNFLSRMAEFRSTESGRRSSFAKQKMTPDALRSIGVPLPPDMRLSSRVFDDYPDQDVLFDYAGGASVMQKIFEKYPGSLENLKGSAPSVYADFLSDFSKKGLTLSPDIIQPDLGIGTPSFPKFPELNPSMPAFPDFDPDVDPYAVWGCGGGGGLSFCGCAGGGT